MIDSLQRLIELSTEKLLLPFYLDWEFWSVIAAGISSLVALAIAFKDQMLWKFRKPKLVVQGIEVFEQPNSNRSKYYIFRLAIKNEGRQNASNVEVDTENLFVDGQRRMNFLPAPLGWTHGQLLLGKTTRDIAASQTVYVDIARFCPSGYQTDIPHMTQCTLWLNVLAGAEIPDFANIDKANTVLELKVFADRLEPIPIKIKINYDEVHCTPPKFEIEK